MYMACETSIKWLTLHIDNNNNNVQHPCTSGTGNCSDYANCAYCRIAHWNTELIQRAGK